MKIFVSRHENAVALYARSHDAIPWNHKKMEGYTPCVVGAVEVSYIEANVVHRGALVMPTKHHAVVGEAKEV